jgi:DNA-binding LacI/PurR family transcriptional regulator
MLIERLTVQNAPPRQQLFPAELVIRESTGPARTLRSRAAG